MHPVHLFIYLLIYLLTNPSVHLSIYPSIDLFIHPSINPSIFTIRLSLFSSSDAVWKEIKSSSFISGN